MGWLRTWILVAAIILVLAVLPVIGLVTFPHG